MDNIKIKKHKYSFEDRNAFLFCYIIIGIPFLFFIFFWVCINFSSIMLAFKDGDGAFSLVNFRDVIDAFNGHDRYFGNLTDTVKRTFILWFLVNIVCVIPSMFSSYVLFKNIKGAFVFRMILMIPTILSGIVWVMIMKHMVSPKGPVISILTSIGVNLPNVALKQGLLGSSETAFITIALINVFPHIISLNLIISGSYARIPEELFEVGKLEGLNFIKEFFIVSVPLVWPTIVVSMISNLSTALTFEGGVFIYTKGLFDTSTMGFYIYNMTLDISHSAGTMTPYYGYPAAVGVTLTAITIPIVLFGKLFLEKLIKPVEY